MKRYVLALAAIALFLAACSQTSSLVVDSTLPQTSPDQVQVYLEPPAEPYRVLGLVTGHSFTGWTQRSDMNKALAKAKREAAKMGANGILLGGVTGPKGNEGVLVTGPDGSVTGSTLNPSSEAKFEAQAIWVDR